MDPKAPFRKQTILTENPNFEPLRVKILKISQRIRDFQPKISRNTCLTRFFWIFHRKVTQGVPFGILSLRFSVFWTAGGGQNLTDFAQIWSGT